MRAVAAREVSDNAKGTSGVNPGTPESIIDIKKRRLRRLEEQQARKGHDTPPDVVMEIEDLRRELGELET